MVWVIPMNSLLSNTLSVATIWPSYLLYPICTIFSPPSCVCSYQCASWHSYCLAITCWRHSSRKCHSSFWRPTSGFSWWVKWHTPSCGYVFHLGVLILLIVVSYTVLAFFLFSFNVLVATTGINTTVSLNSMHLVCSKCFVVSRVVVFWRLTIRSLYLNSVQHVTFFNYQCHFADAPVLYSLVYWCSWLWRSWS